MEPPELFPVYHILTPRRNPNPAGESYRLREIYPRGKSYYAKALGNPNQFNRHIAEDVDQLRDQAAESKLRLAGRQLLHFAKPHDQALERIRKVLTRGKYP